MNINPEQEASIKQLLRLSEDQLMSLLPAYTPEYENVGFAPPGQLEAGRQLFSKVRDAVVQKVCADWEYCEKRKSEQFQNPVTLAASIADIITDKVYGFPPFVIAVIMIKMGLDNLCQCK